MKKRVLLHFLCFLATLIFSPHFSTAAPTPPNLSSPANYSIYKGNATVTFSWSSVSGALEYWANIFPSGNSSNPKFNGSVGTATSKTVSTSSWSAGVYIWQVKARTSAGWSSYSSAREFIVDYPPTQPTLVAPASGSSFNIDSTSTFSWSGPSGASIARYTFRIVRGTDINQNQIEHTEPQGTSASRTFYDSTYDPGTYTWAVRAIKQTPPGYNQSTYETTIDWGPYATRTFSINSTPDFVVTSVNGPANALPGQTVNVTVSARNQGPNPSQTGDYVILRLILSSDSPINLGDPIYQDYNVPLSAWSSGATVTHTFSYTIPASLAPANYYWGAYVDASYVESTGQTYWGETNEDNNANFSSTTVAIGALPDLTGSATVNGAYTAGVSAEIPITVYRAGGSLTNGTYVDARLYWSTDPIWDSGDQQLWEANKGALTLDYPNTILNETGAKTVNATVMIPRMSGGTYYIIAYVDPSGFHNESNENNNAVSYPVVVSSPPSSQPVWVPVYRLYNSTDHDHFYTTNAWERDNAGKSAYKYEKIEFYMSDRPFTGGTALYRYYYGNDKKHYYTTNTSSAKAGFTEGPGVIGYVYPNPADGMVPLAHLESPAGDHFYTISEFERNNAITSFGYIDRGTQCYVSPSEVANNRPQGDFLGIGMFSGAFSIDFTDISLKGVGPALTFTRYYKTYNFYELPFGAGWSHSLYCYAIEHSNGTAKDVTIKWGNGKEDFFRNDGADHFTGINGTFSKLVRVSSDEYQLTVKDQTVYTFARVSVNMSMGASFIPDLPLISIEDKYNNKVVLSSNAAPDGAGRIDQAYRMVNGATTGQSLVFNYDSENRLSSIIDKSLSPNRTIQYGYNSDGYLSSVTDARGSTTQYTYTTDGLLTTIAYPEGNTLTVVYDQLQRATGYTSGTITLAFDYSDTGTTVRNGASTLVNFAHDPQIRANKITYGGNANDYMEPSYLTGNQMNLKQNVRDRNGNYSYFTYDTAGNILTARNSLNETYTYTYDAWNNLLSIVDPRNHSTTFTYDEDGKYLRSVHKPMGGVENFTYYSNGLVNTVTDPTGHSLTYSYDSNGNVTRISDNDLTTSMDFVNDGAGRRVTQYDQQRPTPQTTVWEYDNNDNVVSMKVASSPAAVFHYDRNNRLYNVVDQRGKTTVCTYNPINLLESMKSPDQKTWQYTYDSTGNLATVSLPDGNSIAYTYDSNKRLQYVHHNGAEKVFYTYDNNGNTLSVRADNDRTTSFAYDSASRITRITDPFNNTILYGYDPAGNRTRITYPGNKIVSYTFDAENRLTTVQDWLGAAATTYSYDSAGILRSVTNANGTMTTFGYDTPNRLTSLANKRADNSLIAAYGLVLDKVGNPTSIERNEPLSPKIPKAETITYTYDNANQIQSAGETTFTHDGLGNLSATSDGRSFAYDYANHLVATTLDGVSYFFQYDGFGNRISRTSNGLQTRYLQDLNGRMNQVLAETDAANNVLSYYVYGLGLISRISPTGVRSTYHFDQIGNTVAVTDESGSIIESYAYDEFGATLAASPADSPNPFRYVGEYGVMDEGNGLLHMRSRYYSPGTGRFLTRDPLGFDGGDLNFYAYVGGNPLTSVDPEGLAPRTDKQKIRKRELLLRQMKEIEEARRIDKHDYHVELWNIGIDYGFGVLGVFVPGVGLGKNLGSLLGSYLTKDANGVSRSSILTFTSVIGEIVGMRPELTDIYKILGKNAELTKGFYQIMDIMLGEALKHMD